MNDFFNTSTEIPPWFWVFYVLVILPQGIWLFRKSQKTTRFPWFWGIWGLIQFPLPILSYYIFVIRKQRKKKIKKI